ncbi:hypothetical protein, partial [Bradyrhizobium sp. 25ACV]
TVDESGTVTAVAAGTATITAESTDGSGKSATCTVTVTAPVVPVGSVTLDKTSAELAVGGTLKLAATVAPGDATSPQLAW